MNVFRVALPNTDVARGKAVEMVLDNRYPNPKIDTLASPPHIGTIFLNWTNTSGIADGVTELVYSFAHGYNSIPTAFASYKFFNGTSTIKGTLPFQYGALGVLTIDTDDTNVNIKYYSIDGTIPAVTIPAFTMQIRFYVMAEQGY